MPPTSPRRSRGATRTPQALEEHFAFLVRAADIEEGEREFEFHPVRRWRFDFAWPRLRLAVEIEGGTWGYGRHQRPMGFERDCEKYNEAARLGWVVLRFTREMILKRGGECIDLLRDVRRDRA